MYTQPLIRILCKGLVRVLFRIRTTNADFFVLYTVRSLMVSGACLAHSLPCRQDRDGKMFMHQHSQQGILRRDAVCIRDHLSKKTLTILGSMDSDGLCRRHSAAKACRRRDCVSPGSGTSVLAVSASLSLPSNSESGSESC